MARTIFTYADALMPWRSYLRWKVSDIYSIRLYLYSAQNLSSLALKHFRVSASATSSGSWYHELVACSTRKFCQTLLYIWILFQFQLMTTSVLVIKIDIVCIQCIIYMGVFVHLDQVSSGSPLKLWVWWLSFVHSPSLHSLCGWGGGPGRVSIL